MTFECFIIRLILCISRREIKKKKKGVTFDILPRGNAVKDKTTENIWRLLVTRHSRSSHFLHSLLIHIPRLTFESDAFILFHFNVYKPTGYVIDEIAIVFNWQSHKWHVSLNWTDFVKNSSYNQIDDTRAIISQH